MPDNNNLRDSYNNSENPYNERLIEIIKNIGTNLNLDKMLQRANDGVEFNIENIVNQVDRIKEELNIEVNDLKNQKDIAATHSQFLENEKKFIPMLEAEDKLKVIESDITKNISKQKKNEAEIKGINEQYEKKMGAYLVEFQNLSDSKTDNLREEKIEDLKFIIKAYDERLEDDKRIAAKEKEALHQNQQKLKHEKNIVNSQYENILENIGISREDRNLSLKKDKEYVEILLKELSQILKDEKEEANISNALLSEKKFKESGLISLNSQSDQRVENDGEKKRSKEEILSILNSKVTYMALVCQNRAVTDCTYYPLYSYLRFDYYLSYKKTKSYINILTQQIENRKDVITTSEINIKNIEECVENINAFKDYTKNFKEHEIKITELKITGEAGFIHKIFSLYIHIIECIKQLLFANFHDQELNNEKLVKSIDDVESILKMLTSLNEKILTEKVESIEEKFLAEKNLQKISVPDKETNGMIIEAASINQQIIHSEQLIDNISKKNVGDEEINSDKIKRNKNRNMIEITHDKILDLATKGTSIFSKLNKESKEKTYNKFKSFVEKIHSSPKNERGKS